MEINLSFCNLILNNQINNMRNFQGNLINYNNYNQNNNLIKTFIFHLDNGQKCQTLSIDRWRLWDLYYIAFAQINNEAYRYINNLQFFYDAKDITNDFRNNNFVRNLNLPNFSVISVIRLNNFWNNSSIFQKNRKNDYNKLYVKSLFFKSLILNNIILLK